FHPRLHEQRPCRLRSGGIAAAAAHGLPADAARASSLRPRRSDRPAAELRDLASGVLSQRDMNHETLEGFRRKLLGRRTSLMERRRRALADEDALLSEREPDWEDVAAAATAASVLDGLGEAERGALVRVQSALFRMDRGI